MLAKLSDAERKVFDLIIQGFTCKEIARQLGISPRTVEDHRRQARLKFGARNVTHMVAIILQSMP